MKTLRNKKNVTKISTIALILALTMSVIFVALPAANASEPPKTNVTYVYIACSPNPVGVGQQMLLFCWTNIIPPSGLHDSWDYYIDIVAPDGETSTVSIDSDTAGSGFTYFTPDQIGQYSMQSRFVGVTVPPHTPPVGGRPGQPPTDISNDTYLPAESDLIYVTVQEEKIPSYEETPLPTGYWTRPINAVNRDWIQVAGNWLGTGYNAQTNDATSNFAYGAGPESPHVMWSKPYWLGGIVDPRVGHGAAVDYYGGLVYETFGLWPPIVMNGRLYYNVYAPPRFGWYCVDLYTGETVYFHNTTGEYTAMSMMGTYPTGIEGERLAFGQVLYYDNPNQFGAFGYLWSTGSPSQGMHGGIGRPSDTWMMFDEFTGNYICTLANVSTSGTFAMDTMGGIVRYSITGSGDNQRLLCWNSTKTMQTPYGSGFYRPQNITYDGNAGYSLNVSISPAIGSGLTSIRAIRVDDAIYGGSTGSNNENGITPGVLWKMSLKPGEEGTIVWNKTFTPPSSTNQKTVSQGAVDPEDGVFLFECAQTRTRWAYSMDTMEMLWESEPETPWNFYGMSENIYDGKLLTWGYGGELLAYNITTGDIVWTYIAKTVGLESWYGNTPISGAVIADGKIYIYSTEHSPSMPYRRDGMIRCIDADTGNQLWNVTNWAITAAISDGYLVALNYYDNSIYCYGIGPSATTVTASQKVSVFGDSVLIEGTVTDDSPGGRQDSSGNLMLPLKGTPAIADEYMGQWMEYLFAQRSMPADAKGVTVKLTAIDPNGNYQDIGTTTTDTHGNFGKNWNPPVPGEYYVLAEFEGSKSYGPSSATTYFVVDPAPSPAVSIEPVPTEPTTPEPTTPAPTTPEPTTPAPTTPEPTEPEPTEPTEAPLITTEVAIIAAVAVACIIGIAYYWALRKRK